MKDSKEDVPPNSRLFVLHGKNATKEELQEAFEIFGKVENIWMVRDRETGEFKGVTYIKFSKMSEAAHAVEEMNGVALPSNPRPLKVIIANSRDQGSKKDDDIERFLRLFIVVPKDDSETEQSLRLYFSTFGEVESVNILRNRETNENKGFAYIKFSKMYHTAKALEECDPKFKAVLAKPKEKRNEGSSGYNKSNHDYKTSASVSLRHVDLCDGYASDQGYTKVSAFISSQLTEDLAIRLFDLIPGLAFAKLSDEVISHRTQKMLLEYDTPEAASFAVERLSGFEYPIGEPIMLKPENGWKQGSEQSMNSKYAYRERKRSYSGNPIQTSEKNTGFSNYKNIANLTNVLEEATSIFKAHNLAAGSATKYCTAKLPPKQPMATGDEGKYRLFVVCQPDAPPVSALKDIFCRFGNLVDIYLLPGKNYGYASYSDLDSAKKAIATLHKEELFGNRMKVMEADPPRPESKKARYT